MNPNLQNAMTLCRHGIPYRHEGNKLMAQDYSGQWVDVTDYSDARLQRLIRG